MEKPLFVERGGWLAGASFALFGHENFLSFSVVLDEIPLPL